MRSACDSLARPAITQEHDPAHGNLKRKLPRPAATGIFSTHPNPENRITRIQQAISARFPNGVPDGLTP